ncbi:hypothetical protein LCGC14_1727910 [marine sediment metagenome]|uniref:Uncharacterized protein n=1 Tax=marine sediment metagenome TaxID=412755 RepID=A0A0F9HY80_9ZZZZ|nr:hypothetical protein [Candidatus Scalindua sp.]
MSEKRKAGVLLAGLLKQIALEKTELVQIDGEDKIVSKAESLARMVWQMALGYEENKVTSDGVKNIEHPPNKGMMAVLLDRIDGRAVPVSDVGDRERSIADKITDQGKSRIKEAGKSK